MKSSFKRGTPLGLESLESREVPALALGLTSAGQLVRFDTAAPQNVQATTSVTGLTAGQTLEGIDFGPNGQLFGLGADTTTNTVQLYTINPFTGAATPVAAAQTLPGGNTLAGATQFALDVNPVTGQVQVVTNAPSDGNNTGSANNFTINPTTGAVTVLPDLVFPAGATAPETAIAFSPAAAGTGQTTLFGIATGSNPDQLVTNGTANTPGNTLAAVGSLGVDSTQAALDVGPGNTALAALTVGGTTRLYSVNTTTGAATALNTLGTGTTPVTDLAVLTAGSALQLPARLAVSGLTNAQAQVFAPDAAGNYANTPVATVAFPGLSGVTVRAATADVNGDGTPDTILVTGPGTAVRFAVVSGADNTTLLVPATAPFAGSEDFTGGAFVAAADIDGDGRAEIALSPDQGGGGRVSIYSLLPNATSGQPDVLTLRKNFLVFESTFRGGARVALGDVNGDGTTDIAVAAGFLGGPRVTIFSGIGLVGPTFVGSDPSAQLANFFDFNGTDVANLRNGSFIALGDVDGDGFADLIAGGGPGGAPRVFVLSGRLITAGNFDAVYSSPVANFFVAGNTSDRGGVRVAAKNADNDNKADVAVGSGENVAGRVRVYLGKNITPSGEPTTFQDIAVAGGSVLTSGVFVG